MGQELAVDKVLGIVNDKHHNCFGHHVTRCLRYDLHVRINQVAYGLHLAFQLWIGGTLLALRLRFVESFV